MCQKMRELNYNEMWENNFTEMTDSAGKCQVLYPAVIDTFTLLASHTQHIIDLHGGLKGKYRGSSVFYQRLL